jgi:hypothetical protein
MKTAIAIAGVALCSFGNIFAGDFYSIFKGFEIEPQLVVEDKVVATGKHKGSKSVTARMPLSLPSSSTNNDFFASVDFDLTAQGHYASLQLSIVGEDGKHVGLTIGPQSYFFLSEKKSEQVLRGKFARHFATSKLSFFYSSSGRSLSCRLEYYPIGIEPGRLLMEHTFTDVEGFDPASFCIKTSLGKSSVVWYDLLEENIYVASGNGSAYGVALTLDNLSYGYMKEGGQKR